MTVGSSCALRVMRRPASRMAVQVPGTLAVAIGLAGYARAQPVGDSAVLRRIVHRFDFDERAAGNLEDIPKFWERVRRPGFPHYAYGVFDLTVGRPAAPSFYLNSEGRSVAYHAAIRQLLGGFSKFVACQLQLRGATSGQRQTPRGRRPHARQVGMRNRLTTPNPNGRAHARQPSRPNRRPTIRDGGHIDVRRVARSPSVGCPRV